MTNIDGFPFVEIKQFHSVAEANQAGFSDDHIWSVVEGDEVNSLTFGPPHHFVNVIHYVVTNEAHDHNTYFVEDFEND